MIKILKQKTQIASAAIMTGVMMASGDAMAGTNDLKSLTESVGNQASSLPQFINFGCYVCGTAMVGFGLFGVKKNVDSSGQEPLSPAVGKLAVGGALVAVPAMIEAATGTLDLGTADADFDRLGQSRPFDGS